MKYYTNTGSGFVEAADLATAMDIFGKISYKLQIALLDSLHHNGFCQVGDAVVAKDLFVYGEWVSLPVRTI
jgi:hypothetical protein